MYYNVGIVLANLSYNYVYGSFEGKMRRYKINLKSQYVGIKNNKRQTCGKRP